MRAFLAADSCPSRCRRSTSCSSWVAQGPVTKMGPPITPHPQVIIQRRKLRLRKARAGPGLRPKSVYTPDSLRVNCRCQAVS